MLPPRLDRAFFARHCAEVAPDLLGCLLVDPLTNVVARIVEVEAYDQSEPASHSYRGSTGANAVMFGHPGRLYTYFTYGMHWCANVVTGPEGRGEAVLLRAAAPLAGHETLRDRRGPTVPVRDLLRGPARLAQGFGLDRQANGRDLTCGDGPLRLCHRDRPPPEIVSGPRVGVRLAADLPWRFTVAGDRFVSAYRRHPKAGGPASTGPTSGASPAH